IKVLFTPEDNARCIPQHELGAAADNGCAEDKRWHVRKDGTRFWANGVTISLRNEAGRLCGFAKVMRDDTERKKLEDELQLHAEELAHANRSKDFFLATVSHELR